MLMKLKTQLLIPRRKRHAAPSARSIAASRLSSLMGLMRCSEKPACETPFDVAVIAKAADRIPGNIGDRAQFPLSDPFRFHLEGQYR